MRKIILSFLTISLSCQSPLEETISKSKPPELSPVANEPVADEQQLRHSLILRGDTVTIRMNDTDTSIGYDFLHSYIKLHKPELTKQQLNLITTKAASYQDVVNVLDQMTINQIENYKLLRYD